MVEAVVDEGTISAGSVREGFQELELELKAGHPARLYRLALPGQKRPKPKRIQALAKFCHLHQAIEIA